MCRKKKVKKTAEVKTNDVVTNDDVERMKAYFKAIGFDPQKIAATLDILKTDVGNLKNGQTELLKMFFALKAEVEKSNQKTDQKIDRILTILDGLVVKNMQDMKQEDVMHTARLDRHEAALADHDERIEHLEATM